MSQEQLKDREWAIPDVHNKLVGLRFVGKHELSGCDRAGEKQSSRND